MRDAFASHTRRVNGCEEEGAATATLLVCEEGAATATVTATATAAITPTPPTTPPPTTTPTTTTADVVCHATNWSR